MPSIRSQEILPNGIFIDSIYGTLKITWVETATNVYQLTVEKDGSITNQQEFRNPSIQEITDFINVALQGSVTLTYKTKDGNIEVNGFYINFHITRLKPEPDIKLMASDNPLPPNWWETI